MMALTIAGREFRSLFLSPLAWTILGVIQIILGYMFLAQLDYFMTLQPRIAGLPDAPGVTDLIVAPMFGNAGVILLLVTPLLTMRLISEERRNRTLSLLFTAPVTMTEIVLGKYLGILAFLLVMVAMIYLMPLSLLLGGGLDGDAPFQRNVRRAPPRRRGRPVGPDRQPCGCWSDRRRSARLSPGDTSRLPRQDVPRCVSGV